ncbi:MAG: hypothetical protein BAJALOKI1v1_1590005 [Promethearchaeota archaeon]|nr:MAG: hypothetical protein BAJALOKI1v1_1590005 [Candidatus Lokiarchaeota archaeon]
MINLSKRDLYKCEGKICWNDCSGDLRRCIQKSKFVNETRKKLIEKSPNRFNLKDRKKLLKKRLENRDILPKIR